MIALRVLYLVAPAVVAGTLHAIVLRHDLWPHLARPIDGGRGVLGAHKTWRGVAVMLIGSTGTVLVQRAAALGGLALVDYGASSALLLGPTIGAGYSLAELPNSFVKRRLGIEAGRRAPQHPRLQYLADQGDSAIGVAVALAPFVRDVRVVALVAGLGFFLHAGFDRLLYAAHVKEAAS